MIGKQDLGGKRNAMIFAFPGLDQRLDPPRVPIPVAPVIMIRILFAAQRVLILFHRETIVFRCQSIAIFDTVGSAFQAAPWEAVPRVPCLCDQIQLGICEWLWMAEINLDGGAWGRKGSQF